MVESGLVIVEAEAVGIRTHAVGDEEGREAVAAADGVAEEEGEEVIEEQVMSLLINPENPTVYHQKAIN